MSGVIYEEAVGRCQTDAGLQNAIKRGDVIKKETPKGTRYYFPRIEIGEEESYENNVKLTQGKNTNMSLFNEMKGMITDLHWTISATDEQLEAYARALLACYNTWCNIGQTSLCSLSPLTTAPPHLIPSHAQFTMQFTMCSHSAHLQTHTCCSHVHTLLTESV